MAIPLGCSIQSQMSLTMQVRSLIKHVCKFEIAVANTSNVNSLFSSENKAVGLMKPGQTFTIEPMISEGVWHDVTWPDQWTSVTSVSSMMS